MYVFGQQDNDLQGNMDYYSLSMKKNDAINSTVLIVIYSLISIGAYALCYTRMKNKDIT
jgi:hypothetical protein